MRVHDIPPYSTKSAEIERNMRKGISPIIYKAYNSLPKWKLGVLTKTYKIFMYILFIFLFPGFIMFLIRLSILSSFSSIVRKEAGGSFTVYKKAIDATGLATVIKPRTISKKIHYKLKSLAVPDDARIHDVTEGVQCESIHHTDIVTNNVTFEWVRKDDDGEEQTYYYFQSILICETNFMTNFRLVVTHDSRLKKIFFKEKTQLENPTFEKRFHLGQNDPIKLRQCFTPLIMENYLKYDDEFALSDLRILKEGNAIYVIWSSNPNYLVVNAGSFKDTSGPKGILNGIINSISRDVKEMYTAMAYAESLPFYKSKKTYQKNIGADKKTHRFPRRRLRRLVGLAAAIEASKDEEQKTN